MEIVSRWICVPCHEFKPAQGFCPGSSSVPAEGMMVSSWDERPRVSETCAVYAGGREYESVRIALILCDRLFYFGEVILDELAGFVTLEDCEHP